MSYYHYGHAEWMERQLGRSLSPFETQVIDIVGIVGGGIYNAPIYRKTIAWTFGPRTIALVWRQELATFDFGRLTKLVFLCHEARIRLELKACAPHRLRLIFSERTDAPADWAEHHPNLDEAVAAFREELPANHRIVYRLPAMTAGGIQREGVT